METNQFLTSENWHLEYVSEINFNQHEQPHFPNYETCDNYGSIADILHSIVYGEVLLTQNSNKLPRNPFIVLSGFRFIADQINVEKLACEDELPNYQFVQDIEEQAEISYTEFESIDYILDPPDTFWYFQLDNNAEKERGRTLQRSISDTASQKDATHSIHGSRYQLYLPDPETVERLGTEPQENDESNLETIEQKINTSLEFSQEKISNEQMTAPDLIQGSVKSRHKRVTIREEPITSKSKLVSYQRPRSNSRRRKMEEDNTKMIRDLNASVRQASNLLERRRTAGESSYYHSRQEESSRLNTYGSSSKNRSNLTMSTSSSEVSTSLRGLLETAQNWFINHGSRRERSMERARSLMKRSKR